VRARRISASLSVRLKNALGGRGTKRRMKSTWSARKVSSQEKSSIEEWARACTHFRKRYSKRGKDLGF